VRPQSSPGNIEIDFTYNILAVRLVESATGEEMSQVIQNQVDDVVVVDPITAYKAAPGFQAQQSTLNTQSGFTMLIGLLVIGGFFQIQTLQKVPRIGMLKAIGTSNLTVGSSVVLQIIVVTVFGVVFGSLGVILLSLGMPDSVPVRFTLESAATAIDSLLVIGPIGGLVSVRLALKVEPLVALGLSS